MGTTLLIGFLLLSSFWYIEKWYQIKRTATRGNKFTGKVSEQERSKILSQIDYIEHKNYQQSADNKPQGPIGLGRLYYSTPGRCYRGHIWNGKILETGKSSGTGDIFNNGW